MWCLHKTKVWEHLEPYADWFLSCKKCGKFLETREYGVFPVDGIKEPWRD